MGKKNPKLRKIYYGTALQFKNESLNSPGFEPQKLLFAPLPFFATTQKHVHNIIIIIFLPI